MYTRKGDDQQASYRLGNLNPLHPILRALFIHIIDGGYSVEFFNDANEKRCHFTAYKTADAKFSWPTFDWEKNLERGGYFQCPRLRLKSIDLKNLVHTFLLEHTEYGFSF